METQVPQGSRIVTVEITVQRKDGTVEKITPSEIVAKYNKQE